MIQILHPFIGSNYKWPRSASWFLTSATSWPKVQEKVVSLKLKEKMPSFKRCHSIFQPINFQGRSVSFRGSNLLNKAFLMEAFKFDSFSWGKTNFSANEVNSNKQTWWFRGSWSLICQWVMWKMPLIPWISNIQFIRASVFLSFCEMLRVFMLPAYRKYTALYYQVSLSSPIHIPILW